MRSGSAMDWYGVSFRGNNGGHGGDYINTYSTTVTIHQTCPEGYSGAATQGVRWRQVQREHEFNFGGRLQGLPR